MRLQASVAHQKQKASGGWGVRVGDPSVLGQPPPPPHAPTQGPGLSPSAPRPPRAQPPQLLGRPAPARSAQARPSLPLSPGWLTHSAVGRGSVPAAAPGASAGHGRPVPDGPPASAHAGGRLSAPAAAAALGPGPASAPAPAASAPLTPVEFNDVVQGHVHLVGHGGRGIGASARTPRVSTSVRHFLRGRRFRALPGRLGLPPSCRRSAGGPSSRQSLARPLLRPHADSRCPDPCGPFCTCREGANGRARAPGARREPSAQNFPQALSHWKEEKKGVSIDRTQTFTRIHTHHEGED